MFKREKKNKKDILRKDFFTLTEEHKQKDRFLKQIKEELYALNIDKKNLNSIRDIFEFGGLDIFNYVCEHC